MSKYEFKAGMAEISGFGGTYEEMCQKMVIAGLEWLDSNPIADPLFSGYKNVFGLVNEDNADAKALSKAVIEPAKDFATGAMHHAAIATIMWIRAHSWDEYVKEMSKERV